VAGANQVQVSGHMQPSAFTLRRPCRGVAPIHPRMTPCRIPKLARLAPPLWLLAVPWEPLGRLRIESLVQRADRPLDNDRPRRGGLSLQARGAVLQFLGVTRQTEPVRFETEVGNQAAGSTRKIEQGIDLFQKGLFAVSHHTPEHTWKQVLRGAAVEVAGSHSTLVSACRATRHSASSAALLDRVLTPAKAGAFQSRPVRRSSFLSDSGLRRRTVRRTAMKSNAATGQWNQIL
jgi:hypothetical protein